MKDSFSIADKVSLPREFTTRRSAIFGMSGSGKSNTATVCIEGLLAAGEQVGQEIGVDHTGGYFSNLIGPLGTAGLIERSRGEIRPTEVLFPKGLN